MSMSTSMPGGRRPAYVDVTRAERPKRGRCVESLYLPLPVPLRYFRMMTRKSLGCSPTPPRFPPSRGGKERGKSAGQRGSIVVVVVVYPFPYTYIHTYRGPSSIYIFPLSRPMHIYVLSPYRCLISRSGGTGEIRPFVAMTPKSRGETRRGRRVNHPVSSPFPSKNTSNHPVGRASSTGVRTV